MSNKRKKCGRVLPVLLAALLVLCLMTASVAADPPAVNYKTLTINLADLTGNTILGQGGEKKENVCLNDGTLPIDEVYLLFANGAVTNEQYKNAGLPKDGKLTTGSGVPYRLGNGGSAEPYMGNDSVRIVAPPSGAEQTFRLSTTGAFGRVYLLAVMQGSQRCALCFTTNYSDGTSDMHDFDNPAQGSGGAYYIGECDNTGMDGSGELVSGQYRTLRQYGLPKDCRLYSFEIPCDPNKILTDITAGVVPEEGNSAVYFAVYGVTGADAEGAPSPITAKAATPLGKTSGRVSYGDTGFRANWEAAEGDVTYRLDVATDSGFTDFVEGYVNKTVEETYCDIDGLDGDSSYYYRVRAVNGSGVSISSEPVCVTVPDWYAKAGFTAANAELSYDWYHEYRPSIFLLSDVNLKEPLVVPDDETLWIELNGCAIRAPKGDKAITANKGAATYLVVEDCKGSGAIIGGTGDHPVCNGFPAIDFTPAAEGSIVSIQHAAHVYGGNGLGYQPGAPGIAAGPAQVTVGDNGYVRGGGGATYELRKDGVDARSGYSYVSEFGRVDYGYVIPPVEAPEPEKITHETITIKAQVYEGETTQYALMGDYDTAPSVADWQNSTTFDSLYPNTVYYIYVRIGAKSGSHDASSYTGPYGMRTKAAPADAPEFGIDYVHEYTDGIAPGYEYSIDGGDTWILNESGCIPLEPSKTYLIRVAETSSSMEGLAQTLVTPARPAAPGTAALRIDYEFERLFNSNLMEYSLDEGGTWTAAGEQMSLSELTGKTVTVRYCAKNNAFASETAVISVPARPAAPAAPALKSKTDTVIVLKDCAGGQEYSINGGESWATFPAGDHTYEGLTPGKEYSIITKVPAVNVGENKRFASEISEPLTVTTKTAPGEAPEITPDVTAASVTLPAYGKPNAYEYSTDGETWNDIRQFAGLDPATEYTYYVRFAETDSAMASAIATVKVYTNYGAPDEGEGYSMDGYSTARETKGYPILRFENGYEVSSSEDFAKGTMVSDGDALTPGMTYYLRVAATAEPPIGASSAISFTAEGQPRAEVKIDWEGKGKVTVDGDVDGIYYVGDSLTAAAEAGPSYRFTGWYDGDTKISSAVVMKVTAEKMNSFFAKFAFIGSYRECAKDKNCPVKTFNDTVETSWYHDGVHYCVENGLMNGIGGGAFAPGGDISRAMIVTMLYRLEGSPAVSGEYPFKDDVNVKGWYRDAVIWAAQNGVVNGISKTQFAPDNIIDREQLACMMYRYAQLKNLAAEESGAELNYPDKDTVSGWAKEAVTWCVNQGLIQGMDGKLNPKATASRAQAATIFVRFAENILLKP